MNNRDVAAISKPASPARLIYLDWLRVFAMFFVFLFHSNRLFTFNDWHISNALRSPISTIFEDALNLWIMPFLFVLSGAAVYYSLQSRKTKDFVKERCQRIALPWIVLGMFVMGPVQVYLERFTHGQFAGNFFQFIPHYFEGFYGFGGNFAWPGMHLWYLMQLFVFSMLLLPLFIPRAGGTSVLARLAAKLDRPWQFLLLMLVFGLMAPLADVIGLGSTRDMGSWDSLSYMTLFVLGYLFFAGDYLRETIKKWGPVLLVSGVVLSAVHLTLMIAIRPDFYEDIDLRPFCTFTLLTGLLGTGSRLLEHNNGWRSYANEAVLPFYILHQTVILLIGFFVVQWSLPVSLKYPIVVVLSFTGIMLIYEFLVRRLNVLRFFFGMKRK
ncbi:MAG: acyltransferase family protein [Dehalococcoidales bacterium]|nr:acyltransferase family protein [Dehalococcoidales bacterium]